MPLVLCDGAKLILSACVGCLAAPLDMNEKRSCACNSTHISRQTLDTTSTLQHILLDANAAMTETPNSASCSSVWQALRIMLQLPDLLGEFPLSLPLSHFRFVSSFALASVSVCSQLFLPPLLSLQLCVAFGAVDSRWATTSNLPSSTTISGHTGMHWLVASWRWPWPPVGHCVSVASNAIASITSTLYSMDCSAHCWAVALCSAGNWVSQRRGEALLDSVTNSPSLLPLSPAAVSYYFSFIGLSVVFVACFSYISLRSEASGLRPARISLGNASHACGVVSGFAIFNEFEPQRCGFITLGLHLLLLLFVCINELLQHLGTHNYKLSRDLVFQLLNEERLVFLPRQAVLAQFVGRADYRLLPSRQWLVLLLGGLVVMLQRSCLIHSPVHLQLTWSATSGFVERSQLYTPYALYAGGCGLGALLLLRYTPKLVYLLFGVIQLTLVVALLCIYDEDQPENCYLFLCLIWSSLGVLSSQAIHWVLECSPFLYTELALAVGFVLQLATMESCKYELRLDDVWTTLLWSSLAYLVLTLLSVLLVVWLQPRSASLVDVRNRLLGIRRLNLPAAQTQFWHTNQFLAHNKQPHELQPVQLGKTRVFQQYPVSSEPDKF